MGLAARRDPSLLLSRLHAHLERPWLYGATWRALAPGVSRALLARIRVELDAAPAGGACDVSRVLDVGCGPRSWLAAAGVVAVGVDRSPACARAIRRAGGVAVVARAEALPFRADAFASVWSFGLHHHLSDANARRALGEAGRVAAGRVVLFDGVLPQSRLRRPLAWVVRRLDRGRFLRSEAALRALLPGDGWRASRFTYSWTGLEGLWCVLTSR